MVGQGNISIGGGTRGSIRYYYTHGESVGPEQSIVIGDAPHMRVSYSCRLVGPDFIPLEPESLPYFPSTASTDPQYFVGYSANERTFFSPPICAGDSPWTAATEYTTGETVVPTGAATGYSYFARVLDGNQKHPSTATSHATTEPVWPTTAGNGVYDGDIYWVCVDLSAIPCYLPEHTRLIPIEVGFIADEYTTSATTQPTISWGTVASPAAWKAATITTLLTAAYTRQEWQIGSEGKAGSRTLGAAVTVPGDGITSGRVFWHGIVVEAVEA